MTGFVFIFFLLLMTGIFVTAYNLMLKYASLAYAVGSIQLVLMLTVPMITMRIIAEEKRSRTDQLLYSLPIPLYRVVLAKYFAVLTVFLIPTAIIGLYPLILSIFGSVPLFPSHAALFGFFILGAALLALCMFLSSLCESQTIAAVISFGTLLGLYLLPTLAMMIPTSAYASLIAFFLVAVLLGIVLYVLSKSIILGVIGGGIPLLATLTVYLYSAELFEGLFPELLQKLAVFSRFENFVDGIFDVTAIVYFLSITVFSLFLCVASMEKKRRA